MVAQSSHFLLDPCWRTGIYGFVPSRFTSLTVFYHESRHSKKVEPPPQILPSTPFNINPLHHERMAASKTPKGFEPAIALCPSGTGEVAPISAIAFSEPFRYFYTGGEVVKHSIVKAVLVPFLIFWKRGLWLYMIPQKEATGRRDRWCL